MKKRAKQRGKLGRTKSCKGQKPTLHRKKPRLKTGKKK